MRTTRDVLVCVARSWKFTRVLSAVALIAMAMPVRAVDILLFNTGVSSIGTPLTAGAIDPHWQLVAGPGVSTPMPAFVVNNQHPFGNYFETTDSRWIWVNAGGTVSPGGPYTFRLQFDLTGLDPSTATLAGSWGIDDTNGRIELNGATPTGTGLALVPTSFDNFNLLHAFTITGGFVAGINYLDFTATDVSNPGGLNVTALTGVASAASAIPEPSSVALLGVGLAVLLTLRSLKRTSAAEVTPPLFPVSSKLETGGFRRLA